MPEATAAARLEVTTDRDIQIPGQEIVAHISVHAASLVLADAVQTRLVGRASLNFTNEDKRRFSAEIPIVDETQLVWRYHSLSEMLGIPEQADPSPRGFAPDARFSCRFRLPATAPTSLSLAGCPATVRYSIQVRVCRDSSVVLFREHPLVVVQKHLVTRPPPNPNRIVHSKRIPLPNGKWVILECSLAKTVFKAADDVQAHITIHNKWKDSLKFVRLFITTKFECQGRAEDSGEQISKVFTIEHSGVGLPSDKAKIASGESFCFYPRYNVPALNPDSTIPSFLRLSHTLCVAVGRTHSIVLGRVEIPINIVTEIVEGNIPKAITTAKEDVLIDLSSSPSTWTASPVLDLLA